AMVREALRVLLEADRDFTVVGEAADAIETTALVKELRPDVAIFDLPMRGLNGSSFPEYICRYLPITRSLILSARSAKEYVIDALRHNAAGYLFKSGSYETLADAIRIVAAGGLYVPIALAEADLRACTDQGHEKSQDSYETLTRRQREVLELAARGLTNGEIAGRLCISPRTVEIHRAKLMDKLALRRRAELVRYAYKRNLFNRSETHAGEVLESLVSV
ncbi:MAG TPA: response regulator transcription factor, partial [Pyrinomonadaceae bacterium]|nr:response regulator transcription factor [Pyrinomonadaceae bacterium]